VKLTPLLATPPTVTTTFRSWLPLAPAQRMLVAPPTCRHCPIPLKVTVLVPCLRRSSHP